MMMMMTMMMMIRILWCMLYGRYVGNVGNLVPSSGDKLL